jgi:hypothetical protein
MQKRNPKRNADLIQFAIQSHCRVLNFLPTFFLGTIPAVLAEPALSATPYMLIKLPDR